MTLSAYIESMLSALGLGTEFSSILSSVVLAATVLFVSFAAFYISRRVVRGTIHKFIKFTRFTWDDHLLENKLFLRITLIVPAVVIYLFLPAVLSGFERSMALVAGALNIYFIVVGIMVADALINSLHDIYQTFRVSGDIPLKGFAQVLKIVLYGTGLILVISVLLDRSPIYLLSGLGALTAVLMLVFKDPILGFAGGIQLISNRMLKNGDWIEMPRYGADGDVIDITLTTVKVRNFDNTITTIPTYALINDSFKNWRGMQESQGRRIKRALHIDVNSIRFCTSEMLERYAGFRPITEYNVSKKREIAQYNSGLDDQTHDAANTRRLTNIGTFRAYAAAYVQNHPMINTGLTCMVRQLAPTQNGLPLEIYAFCKDKVWSHYEAVQADIFDHLLAIAPEFDLKIYQYPSGADISGLAARSRIASQRS